MAAAVDDCPHKIPDIYPAPDWCADCGDTLCKSRYPIRRIKCMELAGHESPHFNRYDPRRETWE